MVLLRGAHPAAVRPLVETLLEGHAPGDPEAPCVRVCFSPQELLDAPVGSRVLLVGAERAPEWLNIHRPVVWERELVLLLWVEDDALEQLRRNAPDFLDWVSHRIEVPWFAPERAMAELQLALTRVKWIAVAGVELVVEASKGRREIEASRPYDDLAAAMDGGDVLVRGVETNAQLWRLMIAHAELRWRHRVVLAEPKVLPPFVGIIDARIEDWEQRAVRLESLAVEHPRLVAALESSPERAPFARMLAIDEAHMNLLGRVAREQLDDITVGLARELSLDDAADALDLRTWSDDQITPERIERGLRGGFHESRAFMRHVWNVIVDEYRELLPSLELDKTVVIVMSALLEDRGSLLKAWDPEQEPSFAGYLRKAATTVLEARREETDARFETQNAAEAASLSSEPEPKKPSP